MKQRQKTIEFPETWTDLTEADWRELLKLRHTIVTTDHQWTPEDIRIETTSLLLKQRGVYLQLSNPKYLELISGLQESLTWLWPVEGDTISLAYRSTENLMPKVRDWIGPLSHGADLVFGEFRQAFAHLRTYEQTQDETALQALAGLLYRPEAKAEQKRNFQLRRQPYDWDSLDDKIRRGQRMKPWQLWGIYAWFAYFCEYLTTGTFVIDGTEVSFAPLFAASASGGSPAGSLQQICLTLAESHVFGTARDVDNTPLLTVMQKLLMDYETLQKIKNRKKQNTP